MRLSLALTGLIARIGSPFPLTAASSEGSTDPDPSAFAIGSDEKTFTIEPAPPPFRDWSVQFGVSIISENDLGEILTGQFKRADGDAGGQNDSLTANWVARRFEIPCHGHVRSHLKFDWPIQFTFALPRWPQHQLVLFNDHQSGGHIFDEGGVNNYGISYRPEF